MTQLRSYPSAIQEQFHLVHFTKYDLDAAQCLCMIIFLLNHMIGPLMTLTPGGRLLPRDADLRYFVDFSKKNGCNLLGSYLIQKGVDKLKQGYSSCIRNFQLNTPHPTRKASYDYLLMNERQGPTQFQQDYQQVSASITRESANLLLRNFHNFLKLFEIYQKSEVKGNLSPRKSTKFSNLERTVFLGTRLWQSPDKTINKINLHMIMNFSNFEQAMEIFNTCIEKYQQLKTISRVPYSIEEFTLFALILVSDKLFGFRISVGNFYKEKIKFIKEFPKNRLNSKQKGGNLSILEQPRVYYPTDMEYLSFTQMLWFQTRAVSKLSHLSKQEMTTRIGELSREFSRVDWLKLSKSYLSQLYSTVTSFYSDLFNQKRLRAFWVSDVAAAVTNPFLFEHAKISELRHDSDGIVKDSRTKYLHRFNYDKFHKAFETNHGQLVESLMPIMQGKNSQNQLKVQYLNSLVSILQILTLKQPLAKKKIAVKRINDVVAFMGKTESKFETRLIPGAQLASNNPEGNQATGIQSQITRSIKDKGDWENRFSRLFEKNFKEVNALVTNDFQQESGGGVNQLDYQADPDRIRNATLIQSDKPDISFTFDKLLRKKRPIVVKGQLTESLEEAERYFLRMIEFQQKVRKMRFNYSVDIQKTFKLIQERASSSGIKRDDYDLIIRVNDRRREVHRGSNFAERRTFLLKVLFKYESIPFENYGQYAKIS